VDGSETGNGEQEQPDEQQSRSPAAFGAGRCRVADRDRGGEDHFATALVTSLIHCFAEAGPP
jgi:hypothetical protein